MEKQEIINLVVSVGLFVFIGSIALAWFIDHKIQRAKQESKAMLEAHQTWLFNQLYSMAPGKVLLPDETAPEIEDRPAEIYYSSRDPMNEFTGKKDDWFGKPNG